MKTNLFALLTVILALVTLCGGCAQRIWPEKIVFTPELRMAVDEELSKLGAENPLVMIVTEKGGTIGLTKDGKTFKPCKPPEGLQKDQSSRDTMQKDLPICKGLADNVRFVSFETISILDTHKNPWCRIIRNPDGSYQEKCIPFPWE
jgi:hypothetical protein